MQKIKVAIVGMGYWGPKIARVLNLDSNYELSAVSDLNPIVAESQLSKIGITEAVIDYSLHRQVIPLAVFA